MATSAAKELFALEDASVYRFGRYHGNYKTCETFAESAKKAKGNFIARIKAALGLDFSSNGPFCFFSLTEIHPSISEPKRLQ